MMLTVDEARTRVLDAVRTLPEVRVPLARAVGLAVATDIVAPHPLPRFDNSAMDGYAVWGADTATASERDPVELEILGEIRAGDPGDLKVLPGCAARIMTGAPVPIGADAVVPVEDTEEASGRVRIMVAAPAGRHVRPAGDDVREGDVVVRAGLEVGAGEIALLASLGISPVSVVPRPRIAVMVTGDELVPPESAPESGQIRDSNTLALHGLVADAGGEVVAFDPIPDDRDAVLEGFERAAAAADLVVSSGGVAVGKYDYVKDVLEELGRIDLWRVAMQPGKPVVLGSIGDVPFLGLPGNPVSVHVGFEQFVRPAIRKMRGSETLLPPVVSARLTESIEKSAGRLHFVRVRLHAGPEGWTATPTGRQGSHIQSSLVDCHGVARFDIDETHLDAGASVEVEVWRLPGGEP